MYDAAHTSLNNPCILRERWHPPAVVCDLGSQHPLRMVVRRPHQHHILRLRPAEHVVHQLLAQVDRRLCAQLALPLRCCSLGVLIVEYPPVAGGMLRLRRSESFQSHDVRV